MQLIVHEGGFNEFNKTVHVHRRGIYSGRIFQIVIKWQTNLPMH